MWTTENRARYDRSRLRYPSDLTDEEWALIAPRLPPPSVEKTGTNGSFRNHKRVCVIACTEDTRYSVGQTGPILVKGYTEATLDKSQRSFRAFL
jgi:transposase